MTKPISAHDALRASLQGTLTPGATRALMTLKVMTSQDVAHAAEISVDTFNAWMQGHQPILMPSAMAGLQKALGVENGKLLPHRHHFFDIPSGRAAKDALLMVNTFFPDAQMNQIAGPSEAMASGKIGIYVLTRPTGDAWLVLRHKKTWLGKDLDEKNMPGIHWARLTRDKSKIPVMLDLGRQLEQATVSETTLSAICQITARKLGTSPTKAPSVSI